MCSEVCSLDMHIWWPVVSVACLPLSLYTLVTEAMPLIESKTC